MTIDIPLVITSWQAIYMRLGLGKTIQNEAHYTELLAFVDECFEHFGGNGAHPTFALVDLLAPRIKEYEDRQHLWPDTRVTIMLPSPDDLAS